MSKSTNRIRPGLEVLLEDKLGLLRGRRIGLVCNQATVMPDLRHAADVFSEHSDIDLTTLFGPQHGIRGDVQDNMIETEHATDPRPGIPIYSLYSETREPTDAMLENVDAIVFDLQDVGCRIYTFVYTMANCMRAAKRLGKQVIVCDRPNPINGNAVEGNITEHQFKNFVGQFEIPTRHGMTTGELARMFNEHFGIGCDHLLDRMFAAGPRVIGLDWRTPIGDARARLGADTVVQGNLDPALVLAGADVALRGAQAVLDDNAGHPGHIFNLGHGVQPDTDPGVLAAVVEFVHDATR